MHHLSVYKRHTTHNSSIRSNEGLTLETSAFEESLYGGQFILSTQLPNKTKLFICLGSIPLRFAIGLKISRHVYTNVGLVLAPGWSKRKNTYF